MDMRGFEYTVSSFMTNKWSTEKESRSTGRDFFED